MTVITMSRNELRRLRVLIDIGDGRRSVEDATGLIGVGRRQIYRLLEAFRVYGADGLVSRQRGRPSNRARGAVFRETVLAIVRERYADFGPTPAFAGAGSWRPRSCLRFTAWISASRRCGNG
jgi:transposase